MPRISVALRSRPEAQDQLIPNMVLNQKTGMMEIFASGTKHEFSFDKLYDSTVSQQTVFENCTAPMIDEVLEGYNGCVFAYGQTGAGKTFTMTGPNDAGGAGSSSSSNSSKESNRGLVYRTISYLVDKAHQCPDSVSLHMSVLEIYNEALSDLLVDNSPLHNGSVLTPAAIQAQIDLRPKLTIVDTPSGVVVPGLKVLPISSAFDGFDLLYESQSNRAISEHNLNKESSRSHVIYTFHVTRTKERSESGGGGGGSSRATTKGQQHQSSNSRKNAAGHGFHINNDERDPEVVQSKLHLVDLAGSERMSKTKSTGVVQKEANYINKSLSFLEQVVIALTQSKRDHIPYRQSKLTYLLKDSLGGNCNTLMVACVWPFKDHLWETLSTLRFASRMKCIETHPIRNKLVVHEPQSGKLLHQIEALKKELAMRDAITYHLLSSSASSPPYNAITNTNHKDANNNNNNNNNSSSKHHPHPHPHQLGADGVVGAAPTPWMPELSRAQKFRVFRQCHSLSLQPMAPPPSKATNSSSNESSSSSRSSTSSNSGKSNDSAGGDGLFVGAGGADVSEGVGAELGDIHSLSHVYLLAGTLKAALWEACGGDPVKMGEAVKTAVLSRHAQYGHAVLAEIFSDGASSGGGGGAGSPKRLNAHRSSSMPARLQQQTLAMGASSSSFSDHDSISAALASAMAVQGITNKSLQQQQQQSSLSPGKKQQQQQQMSVPPLGLQNPQSHADSSSSSPGKQQQQQQQMSRVCGLTTGSALFNKNASSSSSSSGNKVKESQSLAGGDGNIPAAPPGLSPRQKRQHLIEEQQRQRDKEEERQRQLQAERDRQEAEDTRTAAERHASFEAFQRNDEQGIKLSTAFEDAKENVKQIKERQKDTVALLNGKKATIDSLTEQLGAAEREDEEGGGGGGQDEEDKQRRASVQAQLDETKAEYRTAYTELKLCKQQLAETQSLKSRAVAALLQAFSAFELKNKNEKKKEEVVYEKNEEEKQEEEEEEEEEKDGGDNDSLDGGGNADQTEEEEEEEEEIALQQHSTRRSPSSSPNPPPSAAAVDSLLPPDIDEPVSPHKHRQVRAHDVPPDGGDENKGEEDSLG